MPDVIQPFKPRWSFTLPYTSTVASLQLSTSQIPYDTLNVRIYNGGSSGVYVAGGSSALAVAAVDSSAPALYSHYLPANNLPGALQTLDFGPGNTISAIANIGASGTLHISIGEGEGT